MTRRPNRWLVAGLLALAVGLAVNSLLGPLLAGVVTYPFSETLLNQTIGLEAVSLLVVAPWCVVAALLVLRGHRAGPVLAVPPAAYAAYMFVQYVVGPQYLAYPPVLPLHLAIFVLGGAVLVLAWNRIRVDALPALSPRRSRWAGVALLLFAVFVSLQYLSAVRGVLTGASLSAEFIDDPSMYWSIFLLDLGIVVPVTIAASAGLVTGATWARKALYCIAGWYTLVPISVSAMGIAMLLNGDPNAAVARVVVLSVAALLFSSFAVWLYRPLFRRPGVRSEPTERVGGEA